MTQLSLAADLAEELRSLMRVLRRKMREEIDPKDIPPPQASLLRRVERHGPATISQLARLEGMRPQSMGAVVAPLLKSGHLSSAPDPHDGRQALLTVTDLGRERLQQGRALRQDWLSQAFVQKYSQAEQQELKEALLLLKRLTGERA